MGGEAGPGMPTVAGPESAARMQRAGGQALDSKEPYGWARASLIATATVRKRKNHPDKTLGRGDACAFPASQTVSQKAPIAA